MLTPHLKFKVIHVKEIHSAKLSRLQKVSYFAAGLGDSWLGLSRQTRWKRRGANEFRMLTEECLGSGATESKMEDGSNWGCERVRKKCFIWTSLFFDKLWLFKIQSKCYFSIKCFLTLQIQLIIPSTLLPQRFVHPSMIAFIILYWICCLSVYPQKDCKFLKERIISYLLIFLLANKWGIRKAFKEHLMNECRQSSAEGSFSLKHLVGSWWKPD